MAKSKESQTIPKPPSIEELLVPEWKTLNERMDRLFTELAEVFEDEAVLPMVLLIAVAARQESGNCVKDGEMKRFCSFFDDLQMLAAIMPMFLRGMVAVHAKGKEIKYAFSLTEKGRAMTPVILEKFNMLKRNLDAGE